MRNNLNNNVQNITQEKQETVTLDDFKIIGKGYRKSKFRRKLAGSVHIRGQRS